MKISALVDNKVMLVLIDSGSSHSFISSAFLQTVGITPMTVSAQSVHLASGDTLISDEVVPGLEWWSNGHTMITDMKVLDMEAYDAILAYDWLCSHSPMTCHCDQKILKFEDKGKLITLIGLQAKPPQLTPVSLKTINKWVKGNAIWAMALVGAPSHDPPPPHSDKVQSVIQQYKDVFSDPKTLPPQRCHDHHIPLLPGLL
jgi:hypothetical protein